MKKFLFVTNVSEDNGYQVLESKSLEAAAEVMKALGHYPCVHQNGAEILEEYKGRWIIDQEGTIQVFDPEHNTKFIVCMDDSKMCGYRKFDERFNNVETARYYIDGLNRNKALTKPEAEQLKRKLVKKMVRSMFAQVHGMDEMRERYGLAYVKMNIAQCRKMFTVIYQLGSWVVLNRDNKVVTKK